MQRDVCRGIRKKGKKGGKMQEVRRESGSAPGEDVESPSLMPAGDLSSAGKSTRKERRGDLTASLQEVEQEIIASAEGNRRGIVGNVCARTHKLSISFSLSSYLRPDFCKCVHVR